MQAVFRPNGSQEVVISNQVNGVYVEIYEGMDPLAFQGSDPNQPKLPERKQTLLCLDKSDARSIGSALIGAASKV